MNLTTADGRDVPAQVLRNYQLQSRRYLSQPVQLDAFEGFPKNIKDFWFSKVMLP